MEKKTWEYVYYIAGLIEWVENNESYVNYIDYISMAAMKIEENNYVWENKITVC